MDYWDSHKWHEVSINNYEATGFLSLEQCKDILSRNNSKIIDYDVDLDSFLKKANTINRTLHENNVQARDRARLVAGLLLALVQDPTMTISEKPRTLVSDVNGRIKELLHKHGKEDFFTRSFSDATAHRGKP